MAGLAKIGTLLVASFMATAYAQDTVDFVGGSEYVSAIASARYIFDPDENLTPEQARAALALESKPESDDDWIELGFMDTTVWVGVTVHNASTEDEFILEFRNPRTSYVDCYVPNDSGGYDVMECGTSRPFRVRPINYPMPAFPIELAPGDTTTILLRLKNNGDWRLRIWLWEARTYFNRITTGHDSTKITIGGLSVLAIFNFLVFISLREKGYLYLSFFILSWMFFFMSNTGIGKMLVWPDFSWLSDRSGSVFTLLMCASFVMFSMAYLESHKHTPKLYRMGNGFTGLILLALIYTCLTDTLFRMHLNRFIAVASFGMVTLLLGQSLRTGNRQARFFLMTWLFVLAGGAMIVLLTLYVLPARWVLNSSLINVMFGTSILLWSFELTGRVKERAAEQRRLLREQVRERTKELEAALADVKTLSGLLPICSHCKKIRDDDGYWGSVEGYIMERTDADFTHGICPDCLDVHFGGLGKRSLEKDAQGEGA